MPVYAATGTSGHLGRFVCVMLLRRMTAVARGVSGSCGCWHPGHLTQ